VDRKRKAAMKTRERSLVRKSSMIFLLLLVLLVAWKKQKKKVSEFNQNYSLTYGMVIS
jgi:hypothetical protein